MSNQKIADRYNELAVKLAVIIGQIQDIQTTCKFLNEETDDNGDPYYDLQPVLEHAGVALAAMVVYADEYSKDCGDENDKE
jgi:hypothetical protein